METKKDERVAAEGVEQAAEQGAEKLELALHRAKKLRSAVKAGPTIMTRWTLELV
jgi:hypothetical protein